MIVNPQIGDEVQVWYGGPRRVFPLHGRIGVVEVVSCGRPRNHGVRIDGTLYVVPCGNLRKPREKS